MGRNLDVVQLNFLPFLNMHLARFERG